MPSLPQPEHLDAKEYEILANQIGDMMIIVGDDLVKKYDKKLNEWVSALYLYCWCVSLCMCRPICLEHTHFKSLLLSLSKLDGLRKGFVNNPKKKDIFQKLVEKVFAGGDVNWGRIAMLFYTVAKIAGKVNSSAIHTGLQVSVSGVHQKVSHVCNCHSNSQFFCWFCVCILSPNQLS